LRHPGEVLRDVVEGTPLKAAFVFKALLPLAFLSLLYPSMFAVALPAFAYNLVSANPSQSSIYFHYVSPILPFIFYAAILGAQRIVQARSAPNQTAARAALCLAIAASTATAIALDCPFAKRITFPFWEVYGVERTCDVAAAHGVVKRAPDGASIAATMPLGPHLAHRRSLRLLWPMKSAALPDTDYIIADLADFRWNSVPSATTAKKNLALMLCQAAAQGYGLEASAASVVLLKRGAASPKSSQKLIALLATYLGPELRALRRSAANAEHAPVER